MNPLPHLTLAFGNWDSPLNLVILAIVLLLVFGRRLPEVGRNLGKGIVEFKKGLAGVEDEMKRTGDQTAAPLPPPQNTQQAQLPQQPVSTPTSAPQQTVDQTRHTA